MKKIVILILVLGLTIPLMSEENSRSPIDSKNLILSGGFGFTSYGGDLYKESSIFTLSPGLVYFIKKGLALGAILEFTANGYQDHGSSTGFAFGPTAAYFFQSLSKGDRITGSVFPYIQVGFLFYGDSSTNGHHYSATGYKIPISAGIAVMVSKTAAVFIKAFYSFDHLKNEDTQENKKGTCVGLNVGFKFFKYH